MWFFVTTLLDENDKGETKLQSKRRRPRVSRFRSRLRPHAPARAEIFRPRAVTVEVANAEADAALPPLAQPTALGGYRRVGSGEDEVCCGWCLPPASPQEQHSLRDLDLTTAARPRPPPASS